MSWDKLSMADRAKYIKLAVDNGVSDIKHIRDTYNSYAKGGKKKSYIERPDLEEELRKEYQYLYDKYPAHVIQDNSYMRVPYSDKYGTIETMLKEDAWYPTINYRYTNPYPNENTIVFNDDTPNPKNAVLLDYLHVLREDSPEYRNALKSLDEFAKTGINDLKTNALKEYQRQLDAGVTPQSLDKLINNEVDGYLRNMFHPGTPEEIEKDGYYPDKRQLLKWTPELYEPTREVYDFLHPTELTELIVTPENNKKGLGGNLFAKGGYKNRINYYDIMTGKSYGSVKPKGKVEVTKGSQLTDEALDEYMMKHPTTLSEITIVGNKGGAPVEEIPYIDPTETDANLKHRAKVAAADQWVKDVSFPTEEIVRLLPGIGDTMDIIDAGVDAYNENYTTAGMLALGLLVPNIIEKPLKLMKRGLLSTLQFGNDIFIHPNRTYKAIKEHRYTPFMSKNRKKMYGNTIKNRMESEVKPFTREIVTNNVNKRNSINNNILELTPEEKEFFGIKYPDIKFSKTGRGEWNGIYSPSENTITLTTRESLFGGHRLRTVDDILATGAHEYGHFWSKQYPKVMNLTVPVKKYYGPNMTNPDIGIFRPTFKYTPGKWESSPDEIIAEVFKHKWNTKDPSVVTIDSDNLLDISDPIAKRWKLSKEDAAEMILNMGKKGYSRGGTIKRTKIQ